MVDTLIEREFVFRTHSLGSTYTSTKSEYLCDDHVVDGGDYIGDGNDTSTDTDIAKREQSD